MKQILFLFIIAFANSVFAEGSVVPEYMNGTWEEASRGDEIDKINFTTRYVSGPSMEKETAVIMDQSRQVGSNDTPDVPYETVCRYRQTGLVTEVGAPSDATRDQYLSNGRKAPTFSVRYSISKIELLPALFNSPNCRSFIAKQNEDAAAGKLNYTWNLTDLMDDVIVDPWYGTIFVKRR